MPAADSSIVQPAESPAPAPAEVNAAAGAPPAPPEAAATGSAELPDSVLKIPAMMAIFSGNPPAFTLDFKSADKIPEVKEIAASRESLMRAGIAFYANRAGGIGTIFNSLKIAPESIKSADEAGTLSQIAPPFQQVNDAIKGSGQNNPVLSAQPPSGGAASPTMPVPPQTSSGAMPSPAPASVQTKLAGARSKNMQPGSPTSGPRPGGGRLLNAVLKRAQ